MIRRYRWQGNFTEAGIQGQLPPGTTGTIAGTNGTLTDIELLPDPVDTTAQQDLDEYMSSLGWSFVEVDPSDTELCELADFNASDAILTNANAPTSVIRNERDMLAYGASGSAKVSYFTGVMRVNYNPAANLRVKIWWVAATAVDGAVRWTCGFEKLTPNSVNVDADNFGGDMGTNDVTNGVNGLINTTVLVFDNAEADSIQPGNAYRFLLRRQSASAGDTMAGDAQLMRVSLLQ